MQPPRLPAAGPRWHRQSRLAGSRCRAQPAAQHAGAIGAFFPVYLNLVAGVRGVDRKLVELGESVGVTSAAMVRRIFLPVALPGLFTGLRTGMGLSWMFLVAAELIAATSGLGYLLTDGRETGRPDIVLAAILLLGVLGKLSDSASRSRTHSLPRRHPELDSPEWHSAGLTFVNKNYYHLIAYRPR